LCVDWEDSEWGSCLLAEAGLTGDIEVDGIPATPLEAWQQSRPLGLGVRPVWLVR
jgi:hypothetical protein